MIAYRSDHGNRVIDRYLSHVSAGFPPDVSIQTTPGRPAKGKRPRP